MGDVNLHYGISHPTNGTNLQSLPGSQQLHSNYSAVAMYIFCLLVAIAVVGMIVYRKRFGGEQLEWKGVISSAIALFVIIGIYMVIIFFSNKVQISNSGGAAPPPGGFSVGILLFYLAFLFFAGIIIYAIFSNARLRKEHKGTENKEFKKYVEQALDTVKMGEDVRGAILRAYKEMERMMRVHGIVAERFYTPREFEEFALAHLNVSSEPVRILVRLFETARYSAHRMGEGDRNDAVNALEVIKSEIS